MAMTSGCGVLNKNSQKAPSASTIPATKIEAVETAPASEIINNLAGEWAIVEVNGEKVTVNGENHPKLTFQPDEAMTGVAKVIGYNGCNYLNGAWNIKGNKITPAGELISTLMACDDAPYEYAVNMALNDVAGYQLAEASDLSLLSSTGRTVMKLRKHNLAYLNGAWRVTEIDGAPITANVKIVIDTQEYKVHGNAGCNVLNGDIVVNLDKGDGIEFKNLATSRMMCPDIATEQAFLLALESVSTAGKGKTADTAVLKNSAGQVIIALKRLAPDELVDE